MSDVHVFVMTVDDDRTFDEKTRTASTKGGLLFREFCSGRAISSIKVGPEHACSFMFACIFQFQREAETVPGLAARAIRDSGPGAQAVLIDMLRSLPDQSVVIAQTPFMNCLRCDGFLHGHVRSRSIYRITLRDGEIHDIVEIDTSRIIRSAMAEEAGEAPLRRN